MMLNLRVLVLNCLFLGLVFCFSSCTSSVEKQEQRVLKLNQTGVIYLKLDNETSSLNSYYQVVNSDSISLLAFFNPLNHALYFYNLSSGEMQRKIKFEQEGPNGLGKRVTAFKILDDETVMFHSYYKSELICADFSGDVKSRYKLKNEAFDIYPVSSQNTPFLFLGENIFIYSGKTSNSLDFPESPILMKYEVDEKSTSDVKVRFPSLYKTSQRRQFPSDLSEPTLTINDSKQALVLSFPLDDSVHVIKDDGSMESIFFGYNGHRVEKPLSRGDGQKDLMGQLKNVMSYSRYGSVKFDPYRNVYLRMHMGKTPKESLDKNRFITEQKIVIADSSLNVLGVSEFVGTDELVFSKDGVLQIIYSSKQEDSLQVRVFDYGWF